MSLLGSSELTLHFPIPPVRLQGRMLNRFKGLPLLALVCGVCSVPPLEAAQTGLPRRVLGGDDSTGRLAIIGPDNSIEWETSVGAIHDAWVLPNGHILYQQGWTKL